MRIQTKGIETHLVTLGSSAKVNQERSLKVVAEQEIAGVEVVVVETPGIFEELRVCLLYGLDGCVEGDLTVVPVCAGSLERRSLLNRLSRGLFGDDPLGLCGIVAVVINSAGNELIHLGKRS